MHKVLPKLPQMIICISVVLLYLCVCVKCNSQCIVASIKLCLRSGTLVKTTFDQYGLIYRVVYKEGKHNCVTMVFVLLSMKSIKGIGALIDYRKMNLLPMGFGSGLHLTSLPSIHRPWKRQIMTSKYPSVLELQSCKTYIFNFVYYPKHFYKYAKMLFCRRRKIIFLCKLLCTESCYSPGNLKKALIPKNKSFYLYTPFIWIVNSRPWWMMII